jgi:hypothetical protein
VLISSDGFEYYVPKKYALEAETIRSMLEGAGKVSSLSFMDG